jgi:hypothetical protein
MPLLQFGFKMHEEKNQFVDEEEDTVKSKPDDLWEFLSKKLLEERFYNP